MAGSFEGARAVSPGDLGAIQLSKDIGTFVADATTSEFLIEQPSGGDFKVLFVQATQGDFRVRPGDYMSRTVTAADATGGAAEDILTCASHGYETGEGPYRFTLGSGDTLPTGLADDTDYWIIADDTNSSLTANTFQVATSLALAQAGTQVDLTSDGTFAALIALGGSANGATSGKGWANTLVPVAADEAEMSSSYGAFHLGQGATAIYSAPTNLTVRAYAAGDSISYWFAS
jgi:hypothetical protein